MVIFKGNPDIGGSFELEISNGCISISELEYFLIHAKRSKQLLLKTRQTDKGARLSVYDVSSDYVKDLERFMIRTIKIENSPSVKISKKK